MRTALKYADSLSKNEDVVTHKTFETHKHLIECQLLLEKFDKSVTPHYKDSIDFSKQNFAFYDKLNTCLHVKAESVNYDIIKQNFLNFVEDTEILNVYQNELINKYEKDFSGTYREDLEKHFEKAMNNFKTLKSHPKTIGKEIVKYDHYQEVIESERRVYLTMALIMQKHVKHLTNYHAKCFSQLRRSESSLEEAITYLRTLDMELKMDEITQLKKMPRIKAELTKSTKRVPVLLNTVTFEVEIEKKEKPRETKQPLVRVKTMESNILTSCYILSVSLEFEIVERRVKSKMHETIAKIDNFIEATLLNKAAINKYCKLEVFSEIRYMKGSEIKEPLIEVGHHHVNHALYIYSEALKFMFIEGGYKNKQREQKMIEEQLGSIYFTTIYRKHFRTRKIVIIEQNMTQETNYSLYVQLLTTRRRQQCKILEITSLYQDNYADKISPQNSKTGELNIFLVEDNIRTPVRIEDDYLTREHSQSYLKKSSSQRKNVSQRKHSISIVETSVPEYKVLHDHRCPETIIIDTNYMTYQSFKKRENSLPSRKFAGAPKMVPRMISAPRIPIQKVVYGRIRKPATIEFDYHTHSEVEKNDLNEDRIKEIKEQPILIVPHTKKPQLRVCFAKMNKRERIHVSDHFMCYETHAKDSDHSSTSSDSSHNIVLIRESFDEPVAETYVITQVSDDEYPHSVEENEPLDESFKKLGFFSVPDKEKIITSTQEMEPIDKKDKKILMETPVFFPYDDDLDDFSADLIPLLDPLSFIPNLDNLTDMSYLDNPDAFKKHSLSVSSIAPLNNIS